MPVMYKMNDTNVEGDMLDNNDGHIIISTNLVSISSFLMLLGKISSNFL